MVTVTHSYRNRAQILIFMKLSIETSILNHHCSGWMAQVTTYAYNVLFLIVALDHGFLETSFTVALICIKYSLNFISLLTWINEIKITVM
jgi:hypothetical protein